MKDVLVDKGLTSAREILNLRHTRIEVNGKEESIKSYLLGTSTKDYKGNLMQLVGADLPYIVERPGLQGFLNGYFTLEIESWRSRLLFNATITDIQTISVSYTEAPENLSTSQNESWLRLEVTGWFCSR